MIDQVGSVVLVASGKGGVGKSTVSTNLALAMTARGQRVGLLDADIYGPSLPVMLGEVDLPKPGDDDNTISPIEKYGLKVMSIGYLVKEDAAVIWRGPMLGNAVLQLIRDVDWGELDCLVVDLPPGTGDVQLSLAQKVDITGAILVTTPQQVALADMMRTKAMFDEVEIHTLGLIENMSYFVCDGCNKRHEIFAHGGGRAAAEKLQVPLLGEIPIESQVRACGDSGEPVVVGAPESAAAKAFVEVAGGLEEVMRGREAKGRRALRVID